MIYVASPYSHPDWHERQDRFRKVCQVCARLIRKGLTPFSPIAHTHPIAVYGDLNKVDWESWKRFDLEMIRHCGALYVLTISGWKESTGVQAEMIEAKRLGIPIKFIDEDGNEID